MDGSLKELDSNADPSGFELAICLANSISNSACRYFLTIVRKLFQQFKKFVSSDVPSRMEAKINRSQTILQQNERAIT
nr:hypothetical protein Iba_chr05dCG1920 [Ipomoea batatas]